MSSMLASDDVNPNFHGARNPDSALHVRIYSRPIQNIFLSQKEGHPIFEDVVYIEIHTPGNQLNIVDTPIREDHKRRFPLQWAHYQNTHGKDAQVVGTPVNQWPLLTAAQAETVKALGFLTVQQVAFASDDQVQKIGMHGGMAPFAFRDRAKRFLEAAAGDAALNKRDEEMNAMRKQIADLTAMLKPSAPAAATPTNTAPANDERSELAAQYQAKFGKAPHHKMKVETIRGKLAA
jgi:hypothetical protein